MTYLMIGIIFSIISSIKVFHDEICRGIVGFMRYIFVKTNDNKSDALKEERETYAQINNFIDNKMDGPTSIKTLIITNTITTLIWPVYMLMYLLSFKFYAE